MKEQLEAQERKVREMSIFVAYQEGIIGALNNHIETVGY